MQIDHFDITIIVTTVDKRNHPITKTQFDLVADEDTTIKVMGRLVNAAGLTALRDHIKAAKEKPDPYAHENHNSGNAELRTTQPSEGMGAGVQPQP